MRRILTFTAITLLTLTLALQSAMPVLAATISLSRTTGSPGNSLTVSGSGFSANETGISVTYDGSAVASSIVADSAGAWSTTFVIPASVTGNHVIDASGLTTSAANVTNLTFTVVPGIFLSRVSGPAGSSVTVTGSGFTASETGITVTYDGTAVASGITANALGGWTATIAVPVSGSGSHIIDASGFLTAAPSVNDAIFSISSGITLNQTSGSPGSSVTVTGSGFVVGETVTVTFDGKNVASATVNSQGGWTATFLVPASAFGNHSVDASGSITPAISIADVIFTITAGISVNPTSGTPGSQITVSGSAFNAGETGITVTFDGTAMALAAANAQGVWSVTFAVPASVSGNHVINASGSTTSTDDVNFTVEPVITLNKTNGSPGTSITVSGAGFSASDRSIVVLYDGIQVASTAANNQGGWSATFAVLPSTFGSHVISALGSTTQATSVSAISFSVTPMISINPAFGGVGTAVEVSGSGFAATSNLRFTFGNTELSGEGAVTDVNGSFKKSITVPNLKSGTHDIKVSDRQNNESSLSFTMESTPPPTPRTISPEDGASVGIVGGATPTLRWSPVTDPSGVTYTVQVDTSTDFVQPILERTGISGTSYTLTQAEALPYGQYYWRVRAIDGASNPSGWTQGWALKSGLVSLGALIAIIVAVVVVIIVVFVLIRLLTRKPQPIPVPEAPAPQMIFGQWREVEPEEPERPRALPWSRRALPAPTKTTRTLSPEDQARLKVVADFAQSLPLVEPGYTADWVIDLLRTSMGLEFSPQSYQQLLRCEVSARFEPAWTRHPLYLDLKSLLAGHPLLQEMDGFVDTVNRSASDAVALLQEIYREATSEANPDLLAKGEFRFIFGIYSDAMSWFRGKSLEEPSERDYETVPVDSSGETVLWLNGQSNAVFAGPLIPAADEPEASKFRALHLRLRRAYRNSDKAKQLMSTIAKLEVQRGRLQSTLSQLGAQETA